MEREPVRAEGAGAPAADAAGARVVHVTTIPASLYFLSGQVSFMRARGLDVHAVSSPGPYLQRFGEQERIPVHGVEMTRSITPVQDLGALWRLWRLLRRLHPDIVHAHTPKGGLLGMMAATLARAPVRVYHVRGLPFVTARGWKRRLLVATERVSCTLAHRVLAVSHSMRRIAIEEGLCPPEKIAVMAGGSGNGVDATGRFTPQPDHVRRAARARLGIPPDALVIGFVGRIVRDKGAVELATAWRALRADERARLLLVGRLDPEDAVPEAVRAELERDPRVRLTGVDPDTPPLYAAMDVVALPTYREGFPNVALEAAAMALPIVATAVPGCVDAVEDGVTGTLVPARDAAALADALRRYLGDPSLRARHGAAARARVLGRFRREVIWEAVAAEYGALLEARGAPAGRRGARPRPSRRAAPAHGPGTFVVSLDFELHWGVRDHLTVEQYRENLLGARRVVPRLLELFTEYGVHATWATVGALMTSSRQELERRVGAGRAAVLAGIGEDERSDPFHFAPTLVDLIARTPHQEIATHTFSHHYCLAPGQTADDFERDLSTAMQTAVEKLHRSPVSLVFPRNQVNEAYLRRCRRAGIAAYRGTERAWFYRPGGGRIGAPARRLLRLVDAYVDLSGANAHAPVPVPGRPLDIPSSRFLRPYSPALHLLEPLRIRRITAAMREAARRGRVFHLWWHPHNFGTHERENLAALRRILDAFVELRREHGMRSLTMDELARECAEARDG